MFVDDEDEIELLRMYDKEQDDGSSSDTSEGLDSDEENRILSVLNYQSTFDTVKPSPNQTTSPLFSTASTRAAQDVQDGEIIGNGVKHSLNENMEVTPSEKDKAVVNFIDMNVQSGVQEKPKETNQLERVRKLQTLINSSIEETRLGTRRPERLCLVCFLPDHSTGDCKRCGSCGSTKHSSFPCIGLGYCKRCKRRGHDAKNCEKRRRDKDCSVCKSDYHRSEECPSLLHQYADMVPPTKTVTSYCYRCSDFGHYGDECPKLPSHLAVCPTAFSKYNEGNLDRYSPSHMKIFSRHRADNDESERDRSRTHSRRRDRSSSQSQSPKQRRSKTSKRQRDSSSSSRRKKSDSKDRSKSKSPKDHRERNRSGGKSSSSSRRNKSDNQDRSKAESSRDSVKRSNSSSAAQSKNNVIYISDDDEIKAADSSVELLEDKRDSSVDSRASSIERARERRKSRA